MQCPENGMWVDYVHDALEPDEAQDLRDHLETCSRCGETVRELSAARGVLRDHLPVDRAPAGLHDRVMAQVRREKQRPGLAGVWHNLSVEFRAIMGALAMAALVLAVHRPDPDRINPNMLLAFGLVWGVTNNSLFRLIFDPRSRQIAVDIGKAALAGLGALVLAEVVALFTPNPFPFESRPYYMDLAASIPPVVAWFLPAFYSMVGVGVVGFLFHRFSRKANALFLLAMSLFYAALMSLVLWLCYIIDRQLIEPRLLAAWLGSVWVIAPFTAWLVSLLPTRTDHRMGPGDRRM